MHLVPGGVCNPGGPLAEPAAAIVAAHKDGRIAPADTVAVAYERLRPHGDPAIFITLREEADAVAEARALTDATVPLYGVPVVVKDNIDVAGMPTTVACPAFAHIAHYDATAVARLRAAGCLVLGKNKPPKFH